MTARLASRLDEIDKVLFVVDRKDLDYQTMKEFFLICFADGITGGIAVILGKSAVGNYENLHKLIQSASCHQRQDIRQA